jgi:PAS domain S-box-containing protein
VSESALSTEPSLTRHFQHHSRKIDKMSKISEHKDDYSFPASMELCRFLVQNSHDGIFVANAQGVFVEVNQLLCDMLGYARNELLALSLKDIISDDTSAGLALHSGAFLQENNQFRQYNLCRRTGDYLVVKLQIRKLADGCLLGLVRDTKDRSTIEEQLRESEERFRLLAESSLTGIYLIQEGQFRYVNTAFAHMFGYTVEEVIHNLSTTDTIYPEDRPLVLENLRRRVDGEEDAIRYVFRGLHKNGSILYVEVHGRRIQYGEKPGVIGTLIDITETKKAEAHLQASEERYRALFNENPSMFFTLNSNGIITAVNGFGASQLGYTEDQLLGRPFFQLFHTDDRADVHERFNACLQSPGRVYHGQFRKKCQDGSLMWIEEFMRAIHGPDGNVQILLVCQNISERKQLEESLKVSQFIFDQASIGIFLIDAKGRIIDVNEYGCRGLGYSKEELCKMSVFDIDASLDRDQFSELRNEENILKSTTIETFHRRKNGEIFPVQIFMSPLPYNNENIRISFVQDTSDREQARIEQEKLEAQLKQVQKLEAIGKLAGGIAHDLNNLLTPILGYGELLSLDKNIHAKAKERLAHMNKAANGAKNLIRQLLAFSRKQVLQYQPLDINLIIDNFEDLIRRTIRENITIHIIKSTKIRPAMADKGQLEQVLMNLVVNASDAMPEGGKLTIETKMTELDEIYCATHLDIAPGNYVMLEISDTGEGMNDETLSKIYEPFFSTKGDQGTGLGLATVYGITKQHKGSISVYSEPGMGTSFKVYLPVAEQSAGISRPKQRIQSCIHGTETILLVEDNEDVRSTVYDILQEQGYTVIAVPNGQIALETAFSCIDLDMLLTDVVMPDMNGKELFSRIAEQFPSIRVLYMSGYTDDFIVHHGILDEGIQFIQKPFTSVSILQKVRNVLDM